MQLSRNANYTGKFDLIFDFFIFFLKKVQRRGWTFVISLANICHWPQQVFFGGFHPSGSLWWQLDAALFEHHLWFTFFNAFNGSFELIHTKPVRWSGHGLRAHQRSILVIDWWYILWIVYKMNCKNPPLLLCISMSKWLFERAVLC